MKTIKGCVAVLLGVTLLGCSPGEAVKKATAQLESENQRLQGENRELKEKVEGLQRAGEQAASEKAELGLQMRQLQAENEQLKAAVQAAQVPQQKTSAVNASAAKPRRTIDPEQFKAELGKMRGWTKQQVAAKWGNPPVTEQGGDAWFYKFDAQDQFGVVYRHIQVNFSDGRADVPAIGQTDMFRK